MSTDSSLSDESNESFADAMKEQAYEIPSAIPEDKRKLFTDSVHILNGARSETASDDVAHFRKLIEENLANPYIHLLLASTLEALGENEDAVIHYGKSIDLIPDSYERGYVLERKSACELKTENHKNSLVSSAAAMHAYVDPRNG